MEKFKKEEFDISHFLVKTGTGYLIRIEDIRGKVPFCSSDPEDSKVAQYDSIDRVLEVCNAMHNLGYEGAIVPIFNKS